VSRTYARLDVVEFGRRTIESGDLDPIYNALDALQLDSTTLNRWLLAYWCLYHAGVASFLAEQPTPAAFWTYLQAAAMNHEQIPAPVGGRWPRGHERRHWRGQNALKSYVALRERYRDEPEAMATYCATGDLHGQTSFATNETFASVTKRAQEHVAFGPWIGFKVADMAERVMGVPVFFDEREVFLFDSPREAAETLYAEKFPGVEPHSKATPILWSLAYLKDAFKDLKAPPRGDRPINVQEVETVLCKWKSHRSGHYPLNNDVREIRSGLVPWASVSPLARRFLDAMPKEAT
jgi:hypothetical protein